MLTGKYPHLFQPVKIGKLTLKNRITNAPTYNFLASYDNHVGEEEAHGEKHVITRPTSLYIPAGLYHGPLNFKVINRPVLFIDIAVAGRYQRIGNTPD